MMDDSAVLWAVEDLKASGEPYKRRRFRHTIMSGYVLWATRAEAETEAQMTRSAFCKACRVVKFVEAE